MKLIGEKIRLIIWDLDNTLWDGTISEENVIITNELKNMLNTLVDRGIMNSICSKNDYEHIKTFLLSENLWDLFIFPKISWESKGPAIKQIVEQSQLRPESILFVDDSPINLEEAKYFVPNINTALPKEVLNYLLEDPLFKGKIDTKRRRLSQYKILESKQDDKNKYSSNEDFLLASNICVDFGYNCIEESERIFELTERTNQLNYTKKRITKEDLFQILNDNEYKCGYVTVKDKYGDYGIIGFFAIRNKKAEHFLFSCRTLGLGVEQWVYAKLGFPEIELCGSTVVELKKNCIPEWINSSLSPNISEVNKLVNDLQCLIIGGCDLEQVSFYINSSGLKIDTQFNYNYKNFIVHREHSEILRGIVDYTPEEKRNIISKVPFYDSEVFSSKMFSQSYDVIIYSPLIDYSLGVYEYCKNRKLKVVYDNFLKPIKPESFEGANIFLKEFSYCGRIKPDRFLENLKIIRRNINEDTVLILLNGSEQNINHPEEHNRYLVHKELNEILKIFCKQNRNTYMIDVNKYIKGPSDHTDNIRHYSRQIYYNIAYEIIEKLGSLFAKDFYVKENVKHKINMRIILKTALRKTGLYELSYNLYRKVGKRK